MQHTEILEMVESLIDDLSAIQDDDDAAIVITEAINDLQSVQKRIMREGVR